MKRQAIIIGIGILIVLVSFLYWKFSINVYAINKEILDRYMKESGFEEIKEERMGSMLVYSDGVNKEYITYNDGEWTAF